jgi:hypothetical protein
MNTLENNKLIAEFLGATFKENEFYFPAIVFKTGKNYFENHELKFHSDWNWLMEVVEKIENLGYNFQITSKDATVLQNHGAIYQSLIYKVDGLNKMQATYQTVVEFIKWYNAQNS